MREGAVRFGALAFWNLQFVAKFYSRNAEELFISLDAAFHFGFQMICCGDPARFQRASECACQSTS